jgi:hypothetical protein
MRPDWDVSDDAVTSEEWRLLVTMLGAPLGAGDSDTLQRAVEILRQLRKVAAASAPVRTGTFKTAAKSIRSNRRLPAHERALAVLFARYAAADQKVMVFRSEVLGEQLISVADVEPWLRARANVPRDEQGSPTGPIRVLAYGRPGCDTVLHLAVAAEGPLGVLADISERLARTYTWSPAAATLFVLSGERPVVKPIRVELREDMRLRARSRITLVVDPTCTPGEVATEYRRQRRRVFGRTRRLTPKLAALAEFTIEHEGLGWPEQMQLWNASRSRNLRYTDASRFGRECEQALTRLRELRLPRNGNKRSLA